MKVILQNAITLNGMIAGKNHDTSWVSDQDWESFISLVKRTGVMIVGRVTYDLMRKAGELKNYSHILTVVLTGNRKLEKEGGKLIITSKSPKRILELLKKRGFKEVLVAGGGRLNKSFIKQGLVDEIYVDVHPLILGQGTPIFAPEDFESKLQLLDTKKLSKNVI